MDRAVDRYPRIREVALDIAFDNGMVNRESPEAVFLDRVDGILSAEGGPTEDDLRRLEAFLATLSLNELTTLACGEAEARAVIDERSPVGGPDGTPLTHLFADIFNEVPA